MYLFQITVKANLPYPIEKEYRINCWKLWTAISRGIKLFRSEEKIKGKKLSDIFVSGKRLGLSVDVREQLEQEDQEVGEIEDFVQEEELPSEERKRIEENIRQSTIVLHE